MNNGKTTGPDEIFVQACMEEFNEKLDNRP